MATNYRSSLLCWLSVSYYVMLHICSLLSLWTVRPVGCLQAMNTHPSLSLTLSHKELSPLADPEGLGGIWSHLTFFWLCMCTSGFVLISDSCALTCAMGFLLGPFFFCLFWGHALDLCMVIFFVVWDLFWSPLFGLACATSQSPKSWIHQWCLHLFVCHLSRTIAPGNLP